MRTHTATDTYNTGTSGRVYCAECLQSTASLDDMLGTPCYADMLDVED